MLPGISIFGGLLIMMGHHTCSEALFYYFTSVWKIKFRKTISYD
jgi:hypothetical protein